MTEENKETEEKKDKQSPDIVQGTVTNVKDFGAFVKLENGQEGLVHISEIANEYVQDINDFVKVGDSVPIKILGVNQRNNKLDLSIKKAKDPSPEQPAPPKREFQKRKPAVNLDPDSFESRLNMFLKRSEEKQIDIRRNLKNKHKIGKKKRRQ